MKNNFIFLLLILFIFGCKASSETFYTANISYCRDVPVSNEYNLPLFPDNLLCFANYGKTTKDFIQCADNDNERPYCMGGVAVASHNLSICSESKYKDECFFGAGLVSDIEFCNQLNEGYSKEMCILGFSYNKKDKNICEQLSNASFLSYDCYLNIAKNTKDPHICESMQEGFNQECFFRVAIERKDKYLCKKSGEQQEKCEAIVIDDLARRKLDYMQCYEIKDYYQAADCVIYIAIKTKDDNLCSSLMEGFAHVYQDCYSRVAIEKNDLSLCEKSIGGSEHSACYTNILERSSNPEQLCKKVKGFELTTCLKYLHCDKGKNVKGCLEFIYNVTSDVESCKYQETSGDKNNCYSEIAVRMNSPAICLKGGDKDICLSNFAYEKNISEVCELGTGICYIRLARLKNERNLCFKITDENKADCLQEFDLKV